MLFKGPTCWEKRLLYASSRLKNEKITPLAYGRLERELFLGVTDAYLAKWLMTTFADPSESYRKVANPAENRAILKNLKNRPKPPVIGPGAF